MSSKLLTRASKKGTCDQADPQTAKDSSSTTYMEVIYGTTTGVIKGDTRSLEYNRYLTHIGGLYETSKLQALALAQVNLGFKIQGLGV